MSKTRQPNPATPTAREHQADPFIRMSYRVRLAIADVIEGMDLIAQANSEHGDAISKKLDDFHRVSSDLLNPLEEISDDLRLAWLRGELNEPAEVS